MLNHFCVLSTHSGITQCEVHERSVTGPPGSGKTSFVELLSQFLNIYHVPMRKDNYSKASTSVDLWFYDELTVKRVSSEVCIASEAECDHWHISGKALHWTCTSWLPAANIVPLVNLQKLTQ